MPPGGDHVHQGVAVGQSLSLPQPADGGGVAGGLAVLPGQVGRRPHQGVEPLHRQAGTPHHRPPVVPVAVVDQLMGEDVVQVAAVQGGPVEVDGGPEQPGQTGGGQAVHHIHRQGAVHGQRFRIGHAQLPQPPGKPQIDKEEPHRHQSDAGVPDVAQEGESVPGDLQLQAHIGAAAVRVSPGLLRRHLLGVHHLHVGDVLGAQPALPPDPVHVLQAVDVFHVRLSGMFGAIGLLSLGGIARVLYRLGHPGALRQAGYGHRQVEQGTRYQDTNRSQQPQGVHQPGVRPAPQRPPQQHQHGD